MGEAEVERAAPQALTAERSGVEEQWQVSLAPARGQWGLGRGHWKAHLGRGLGGCGSSVLSPERLAVSKRTTLLPPPSPPLSTRPLVTPRALCCPWHRVTGPTGSALCPQLPRGRALAPPASSPQPSPAPTARSLWEERGAGGSWRPHRRLARAALLPRVCPQPSRQDFPGSRRSKAQGLPEASMQTT